MAVLLGLPSHVAHLGLALGFAGIAALSISVPLRFETRGGIQGINLSEGAFVPLVLTQAAGVAPLALALAALVGYGIKVRDPVKVVFNVAQVTLWSSVAAVVFWAVGGSVTAPVMGGTNLLAVVLATVTLNLISMLALAGLFHRLEGRGVLELLREVGPVHGLTWLGNTSAGLLLGIVARQEPLGIALAAPLLVGMYLGYRGYVGVIEERARNDELHQVSRVLTAATGRPEMLEDFLARLARLLGGSGAEMVLTESGGLHRLTFGDARAEDRSSSSGDPVLDAMRRGTPVHLGRGSSGGDTALAVPLVSEGETIGALSVTGRHGLEPWDETDLVLLSTIANEAAVSLKNVELFAEVEHERRRLEDESRKLSEIVDAASDGIVMVSSGGQVRAWNAAMEDITGVTQSQAVGQPWFVVMRLRDPAGSDLLVDGESPFHRALAGQRLSGPVDVQLLRRDGAWRWLRCTMAPARIDDADEGASVVMVARDVTSEREVEELKADFVATVSHELRTPLTPIKGFLSTLRSRGEGLAFAQMEPLFEAMAHQVERLERLVADLLVVADLDRGAMALTRSRVDVREALEVAVEFERPHDDEDRVVVRPGAPALAAGDPNAVVRILRALLSNAVKHTDTTVSVQVETSDGQVLVHIHDDGPGIAPWEQERIFQRFHRLGDHLTRTQGPGLGLPIAQALARRLNGEVTVRSDVGSGSTFTLHLPAVGPRKVADRRREVS